MLGINADFGSMDWQPPVEATGGLPLTIAHAQNDGTHIYETYAAMSPSRGPTRRELPSTIDILAEVVEEGYTTYDLPRQGFLGGAGLGGGDDTDWHTGARNWEGGQVPDANDHVFITTDKMVDLNGNAVGGSLKVAGGSVLRLNGWSLAINGPAQILGSDTDATEMVAPLFSQFNSVGMLIQNAKLTMDGGIVQSHGDFDVLGGLSNPATIEGNGTVVNVNGMTVEGDIRAKAGSTSELELITVSGDWNFESTALLAADDGDLTITNGQFTGPTAAWMRAGAGRVLSIDTSTS